MYNKSKIYRFYLMKDITNNRIRITSVHNEYGTINFRTSKNWKIISECISEIELNSKKEYKEHKKLLNITYKINVNN